ncbi:MAG: isochorismatase family cysteine hydrolase [Caldilineaceae bacterium]
MTETPNPNSVPNMLAHEETQTVLLLIDVINDLEFEGGEQLLPHALKMAEQIAALKHCAQAVGIPTIYVNDNFGQWRSDFSHLVEHCLHDGVRGEPIAQRLKPAEDDYFVLKPKHSGFYLTTLDLLLQYLGAKTLILAGMAGDICVLFTANDAYMRDYKLYIPADCVASNTAESNERALQIMERALKADTRLSKDLDLENL